MIAIEKKPESEHQIPDNWIEELQPALIRFATQCMQDDQLAEDAVQDALLTAYRSIEQFRGDGSFRAWVYKILRRKMLDSHRKETRIRQLFSAFYEERRLRTIRVHDASQHLQLEETRTSLMRRVENLAPRQAVAIKAFWLEGLTCGEIAQREGITSANVWIRIHRARKQLASQLP